MSRHRTIGVLGSLFLIVGGYAEMRLPTGTWADHGPVGWLHGLNRAVWIGMALSFVGLLLLTWAWWLLVRRVRGRADGVRQTFVTVAWWSAPLFLAPPLFSGDGWSYAATGYLAGHGLSPYLWPPAVLPPVLSSGVHPAWLFTPTPYGPVPLAWGGVFSHLTSNPWLLLAAYRVLAVIGLGLIGWAVARLAERAGKDPAVAVSLVVASPFVIAHGVGGLHNDMVMVGLALCALVVATRDHWLLAAFLVGLSAAVKVPGAFIAIGVVLLSLPTGASLAAKLVRAVQVGVVAVVTLVVTGLASGLGMGWLQALWVPAADRTRIAVLPTIGAQLQRAELSLGSVGHHLAAALPPVTIAKDVGILAVFVVAIAVLFGREAGHDAKALRSVSGVMVTVTLLSPIIHFWYLLWCIPLLVAVELPRPWQAAVVAEVVALSLSPVSDASLGVFWVGYAGDVLVMVAPIAAAYCVAHRQFVERQRAKAVPLTA